MAVFNPLPEGDPRFAENQRAYENRQMQAEFERKAAEQKMYDDLIASKGFQPVQEDQADPIEKMRLQKMSNPWTSQKEPEQREPDASSKAMITPPPPTQMQAPVAGKGLNQPDTSNVGLPDFLTKDMPYVETKPQYQAPAVSKEQQDLMNNAVHREQANADLQQANMRAYLQKGNTLDVGPMIALLDKTKGARISDAYNKSNKVETVDDIANSAAKMQDMAGKAQQAVADDQLKIANNKVAQQQAMQMNRFLHQDSQLEDKQAFQAHKTILQKLDQNKGLQNQLAVTRGLEAAATSISTSKNITKEQVEDFQSGIIAALQAGRSGQGSMHERMARYFNSIGWDVKDGIQYLTGNPAEISKNDALLKHLKDLASIEARNSQAQSGEMINNLVSGYEHIYENPKYKQYRDSLTNKIKSIKKLTDSPNVDSMMQEEKASSMPSQQSAPQQAPRAKTMMSKDGKILRLGVDYR